VIGVGVRAIGVGVTVGVCGGAGQPFNAAFTARRISSMVMCSS
jgi:hypothetical protein